MRRVPDNAWVAMGGSITIAILNGGPPGVIYEFLAACFYYAYVPFIVLVSTKLLRTVA